MVPIIASNGDAFKTAKKIQQAVRIWNIVASENDAGPVGSTEGLPGKKTAECVAHSESALGRLKRELRSGWTGMDIFNR